MSFEMYFLIVCASLLLGAVIVLTVSTIVMGSNHLLRLQFMFSSLKFDKEIEQRLTVALDKLNAGLLIARLENKVIQLYTPAEIERRQVALGMRSKGDRYVNTETHGVEIWVGNKYTQYGYLQKFHDISSRELREKTGSYKTFRRIMALEAELRAPNIPTPAPEVKKVKEPTDVELM